MGLNPVEASEFRLGYLCNCFSCFLQGSVSLVSLASPWKCSQFGGQNNKIVLHENRSQFPEAKISFVLFSRLAAFPQTSKGSILYPQCTHDLYISYTSHTHVCMHAHTQSHTHGLIYCIPKNHNCTEIVTGHQVLSTWRERQAKHGGVKTCPLLVKLFLYISSVYKELNN